VLSSAVTSRALTKPARKGTVNPFANMSASGQPSGQRASNPSARTRSVVAVGIYQAPNVVALGAIMRPTRRGRQRTGGIGPRWSQPVAGQVRDPHRGRPARLDAPTSLLRAGRRPTCQHGSRNARQPHGRRTRPGDRRARAAGITAGSDRLESC
jgi:hypothetical protein